MDIPDNNDHMEYHGIQVYNDNIRPSLLITIYYYVNVENIPVYKDENLCIHKQKNTNPNDFWRLKWRQNIREKKKHKENVFRSCTIVYYILICLSLSIKTPTICKWCICERNKKKNNKTSLSDIIIVAKKYIFEEKKCLLYCYIICI